MGTCLHMWALMYSTFVHMCRVYVARSGSNQRVLVTLLFHPSPIPFSGPLLFLVLFLETKVKRKSNKDSHPQSCCLQRDRGCEGEGVFV